MSTPTPLPELEQQLHAAATRLDATAAARPRRRWWRHGWAILGVGLAVTGTSAAVARVVHVGPFSYLDRFTEYNAKLAPTAVVTVDAGGDAPRWLARASLNTLGQLCITGGPRDPRKDPLARSTETHSNNPPQSGMLCADSDEIAQGLVDPNWPGSTFAASSGIDGDDSGNRGHVDAKGRFIHDENIPATRLVVYAVSAAGGPAPKVRWYGEETEHAMKPSTGHLRMTVDKSPEGLSEEEQALVATYPDALDLVLWAAEVEVPDGVKLPQVVFPWEFLPRGDQDGIVELAGERQIDELVERGKQAGWTYARHISRDPRPVSGATSAAKRWVKALARPRRGTEDAIPTSARGKFAARERQQYDESRRLEVVGGGLGPVWVVPGGFPEEVAVREDDDGLVCLVGSPVFAQCKANMARWKKPMLEAVSCSEGLGKGETLVWALTPPGAETVTVRGPGTRVERFPAAELLAVRRPAAERVTAVTWTWPTDRQVRVRVPWPKHPVKDCADREEWKELRRDSQGNYSNAGRPPGSDALVVAR